MSTEIIDTLLKRACRKCSMCNQGLEPAVDNFGEYVHLSARHGSSCPPCPCPASHIHKVVADLEKESASGG